MDLAAAVAAQFRDGSASWVAATLHGFETEPDLALVSWHGSPVMRLPYLPSEYAGANVVKVDKVRNGILVVAGPLGASDPTVTPQPPPVPPAADEPVPADTQDHALILPVWSGTWSADEQQWDQWKVTEHGRGTLWQGDAYGSGPLTGMAVYGSQVAALGAVRIDEMSVRLPLVAGGGTAVVQGTSQGSEPAGAPTPSGATAAGDPTTSITLPGEVAEAFRTDALRGLVLVGSDHLAVAGAGRGDGMALSVTYTRPL